MQSRTTITVAPTVFQRPPRVESLTGLRWFAAFAVFGYHVNQVLHPNWIGPVMRLGDAGVTFFYVLSGFVLTWSFSPTVGKGTFWWRRFARVWPMLLLSTVIAWIFLEQTWATAGRQTVLSLTMVEAWFQPPATLAANPVAWSISCEAFFYLMFPFLVRPILRLRGAGLAALAGILLVVEWAYWYVALSNLGTENYWVNLSWMIRFPPYRLAEFVLGMVVAAAVLRGWRPRVPMWLAVAAVAVSAGALILGADQGWWGDVWTQQGLLVGCVLVVLAGALGDLNGRSSLLRGRVLVALGKWSYAFYLVHLSVIMLLVDLADPTDPISWTNARAVLIWAVAATALSAACYVLYEHPVENWLRRLYPRRPAPQTPPVPTSHAAPVPAASTVDPNPLPDTAT